jgi:NTP pyrophosphatase (non-canonical NTP hydrolase)
MTYASYRDLETKILIWGDARKITTNGTPVGQAKKTMEEAGELLAAVTDLAQLQPGSEAHAEAFGKAKDGIGDTLVTLIMVGALLDVDVVQCLSEAYEEIKDRKGYLGPDGIFHKE